MEILLPICILFFFFVSVISIYSSSSILSVNYSILYIKQLIWYIIGFIIFFACLIVGNDKIIRYSYPIYIASIILLILVLLFGNEVNNTKGWITFGSLGFQPSEFAKLSLILFLSKLLNDYHFKENKNSKSEFNLILKILLITFIPSILVFVEPDTGAVISYLVIAATMIFFSEVRKRWLIVLSALLLFLILGLSLFYIYRQNEFINILGSGFYYRINRIVEWKASSGMQLENSLIAIGTSGFTGFGIGKTPIYFPEPYTDFIFSIYTSNFGLIGAVILLMVIFIFDYQLIKIGINSSRTLNKYIIAGIAVSFIYPQIQNIAMTIGVLPIMGITLPFISYGGSSLLVSFIMVALVINSREK